MITLAGKTHNAGYAEEWTAEGRTFASYPDILRYLTTCYQWGGAPAPRPVERVYLGTARDQWAHQRIDGFRHWDVPREVWERLHRLHTRYVAYLHYVREVLPEWRETTRIPWMDNSVESVQTDKWGNTRRVTLVGSHGDVC